MAEHDGSTGALLREYIWLGGMLVAMVDGPVAAPVYTYVHTGHLDEPILTTNAAKQVTSSITRDPFGNAIMLSGSAQIALGYPGQWHDQSAGLYQNWNRDYDPSTGRYLETDPIGLAGGTNLYAYTDGNPVNAVDPRGLLGLNGITGIIGGITGGGGNLIGQLHRNGGRWECVDITDVLVATAVGGVAGFVAPFAAPSYVGAIGLGGISNVAQTGLSGWLNGRPANSRDILLSAAIGSVSGLAGGGVGKAPGGRSATDAVWETSDATLNRLLNESSRVRFAFGRTNFVRSVIAAAIGNSGD